MSVDLIHLWGTMGWFAKGVVIIMAFMSIWSLTVMIQVGTARLAACRW